MGNDLRPNAVTDFPAMYGPGVLGCEQPDAEAQKEPIRGLTWTCCLFSPIPPFATRVVNPYNRSGQRLYIAHSGVGSCVFLLGFLLLVRVAMIYNHLHAKDGLDSFYLPPTTPTFDVIGRLVQRWHEARDTLSGDVMFRIAKTRTYRNVVAQKLAELSRFRAKGSSPQLKASLESCSGWPSVCKLPRRDAARKTLFQARRETRQKAGRALGQSSSNSLRKLPRSDSPSLTERPGRADQAAHSRPFDHARSEPDVARLQSEAGYRIVSTSEHACPSSPDGTVLQTFSELPTTE